MKNKKINIMVIIALLLVVSFFASGNDPAQQEKLSSNNVQMTVDNNYEEQPTDKEVNSQSSTEKAVELNLPDESENRDIEKDQYSTDPVPEGKPKPVEWQETNIIEEKESHVILSVNCSTILDNIENLDPNKIELVPENGIIFEQKEVVFYEGESVFDVLLREMQNNKIHMEFVMTPIYNSNYIEGIQNLYEFDCGELSGWMYKVNDWFPNYGCSRYLLKEGDVIEWLYTCDLGRDLGQTFLEENSD